MKFSKSKYREFWNSKMAAGGHLEKLKIRHSQLILIVKSNVIYGLRRFWPSWIHFCNQISLLRSTSRWPPAAILDCKKKNPLKTSIPFFHTKPCQLWCLLLKTSQRSKMKVWNSKYRKFQKSKMAADGHIEKSKIIHSQLILIVQSNVMYSLQLFWPS